MSFDLAAVTPNPCDVPQWFSSIAFPALAVIIGAATIGFAGLMILVLRRLWEDF